MYRFIFSCIIFFIPNSVFCLQSNVDIAKHFFNFMNKNNVNQVVNEFYDNDVFFEDPIHRIKGRESVIKYYESMYKNVVEIKFDFSDSVDSGQMVVLVWTMKLRAKGLRNAEELIVAGNSVLKFNSNGKVFYHRDYFDMGEFIYENLPILNVVIRKIKEKLKE